jgi:hypothetical protein
LTKAKIYDIINKNKRVKGGITMAKVPFSKLKCKIDDSVKEVKLTDDIVIEVKQYLPIQEKLELIGKVIM